MAPVREPEQSMAGQIRVWRGNAKRCTYTKSLTLSNAISAEDCGFASTVCCGSVGSGVAGALQGKWRKGGADCALASGWTYTEQ